MLSAIYLLIREAKPEHVFCCLAATATDYGILEAVKALCEFYRRIADYTIVFHDDLLTLLYYFTTN